MHLLSNAIRARSEIRSKDLSAKALSTQITASLNWLLTGGCGSLKASTMNEALIRTLRRIRRPRSIHIQFIRED